MGSPSTLLLLEWKSPKTAMDASRTDRDRGRTEMNEWTESESFKSPARPTARSFLRSVDGQCRIGRLLSPRTATLEKYPYLLSVQIAQSRDSE